MLTSVDLRQNFSIPDSYNTISKAKSNNVPNISYGTLWSNNIDTFWLFGGQTLEAEDDTNSIWRYRASEERWEVIVTKSDLSPGRPVDGAGCNVPLWSTGYYLGGYIMTNKSHIATKNYLHSMVVFDMDTDSVTTEDVPEYIPVVGQSLEFLNARKKGVLIVMGGYTAINNTLTLVSQTKISNLPIISRQVSTSCL